MNLPGDLSTKYIELSERLDRLAVASERLAVQNDQLHSVAYREWEPFVIAFGNVTDSNKTLTLKHHLFTNGWEGYVDRVTVTVAGASAAATVATYRGDVSDTNLIDWASALYGNSPSRIAGDYNSPIYFRDDDRFCAVVTSSADVGNAVTVRVEGRRRQA